MNESEIIESVKMRTDFGDNRGYVLMAIARRKFNEGITNSQEVVHRRVVASEKDVEMCVHDLLSLIDGHDLHFRLYLTVNARDLVSAYHSFVQELVGWSEEMMNGHEETMEKIPRLGSEWKSQVHAPKHRCETIFLFDLDNVTLEGANVFKMKLSEETTVVDWTETPNGYHILSEPFNYNEWEPPVDYDELDTDGMVFIAEIDNRDGSQ